VKHARASRLSAATLRQRVADLLRHTAQQATWEAELAAWPVEAWTTYALNYMPSKITRLRYTRHLLGHAQEPSTCSSTSSSTLCAPSVQQLLTHSDNWVRGLPGGLDMFDAWRFIDDAVSSVPAWQAEWQALSGAELRQLLADVLQQPSLAASSASSSAAAGSRSARLLAASMLPTQKLQRRHSMPPGVVAALAQLARARQAAGKAGPSRAHNNLQHLLRGGAETAAAAG
jgi:hypothetical protein